MTQLILLDPFRARERVAPAGERERKREEREKKGALKEARPLRMRLCVSLSPWRRFQETHNKVQRWELKEEERDANKKNKKSFHNMI